MSILNHVPTETSILPLVVIKKQVIHNCVDNTLHRFVSASAGNICVVHRRAEEKLESALQHWFHARAGQRSKDRQAYICIEPNFESVSRARESCSQFTENAPPAMRFGLRRPSLRRLGCEV